MNARVSRIHAKDVTFIQVIKICGQPKDIGLAEVRDVRRMSQQNRTEALSRFVVVEQQRACSAEGWREVNLLRDGGEVWRLRFCAQDLDPPVQFQQLLAQRRDSRFTYSSSSIR